ncbi:MAG: hypothetical protein FWD74_12575 [Actinomycetia bacterium]|nr:hypothetical protein [Actinomycetes bacterium]
MSATALPMPVGKARELAGRGAAAGHDVRVTQVGFQWIAECLAGCFERRCASELAATRTGLDHLTKVLG